MRMTFTNTPTATWLLGLILSMLLSLAEAGAATPPNSREDYAALLNQAFIVSGGKGARAAVELQLIEVSPATRSGPTEQFTLLFKGPGDYPLEKAVLNFQHPSTGLFSLFLEPGKGPDADNLYYQVILNLFKQDNP